LQAILEIPSYLGTSVLEAYKDDPDVKFILTERDPKSFVRSMEGSVGTFLNNNSHVMDSWGSYFNAFAWSWDRAGRSIYMEYALGATPNSLHSSRNLELFYKD